MAKQTKQKNSVTSFFWYYLKGYKWQLSIITIAIVFSTYLQVKAPEYTGKAIEELATYAGTYFAMGEADKGPFVSIIKLLVGLYLLNFIAMFIQNILMSLVTGKSVLTNTGLLFCTGISSIFTTGAITKLFNSGVVAASKFLRVTLT